PGALPARGIGRRSGGPSVDALAPPPRHRRFFHRPAAAPPLRRWAPDEEGEDNMAGPEPVSTIAGRAALLGMTQAQLEGFMASLGEPRYRARQVFQWLFRHRAADFQAMTNLPAALRTLLEERA